MSRRLAFPLAAAVLAAGGLFAAATAQPPGDDRVDRALDRLLGPADRPRPERADPALNLLRRVAAGDISPEDARRRLGEMPARTAPPSPPRGEPGNAGRDLNRRFEDLERGVRHRTEDLQRGAEDRFRDLARRFEDHAREAGMRLDELERATDVRIEELERELDRRTEELERVMEGREEDCDGDIGELFEEMQASEEELAEALRDVQEEFGDDENE